ncbi:MAG TPA: polyprenol monophosphomannose synthase [Acidimicrobiales bacterium]|jgi:dolichol-phosphate mannosyltransferase|nr:polyprenol monophosphomannose synthase [Acidimicrobiales bacterium]
MRTMVVVPTYEEAANIAELLQRIRAAAPDVDVLVVDDNSPDGTAKLAQALNEELGHVDVLVREVKAGLGTAYRAGFAIGIERGYEVIVQMDADLSHDPSAIPLLVGGLTDDVGLVIGSRYVPGGHIPHWPWYRRFLSRYGNLYTRLALGLQAHDLTSGFRAWKASTLENINYQGTNATGYLFQMELAYRVAQHGENIAEVPITFTDRVRGTSKMSGAVIFEELTRVTWWGLRDRWRRLTHR